MKKTLIALAAVAVVSAASAQVTVYGKADVGIKNSGATTVASSVYETSRLGFKGTTDLGSGLKGSFQLEGAIDLVAGSISGFNRVATVGVSGAFGTVTVGRQWSLYDGVIYYMDAMEYNGFTSTNAIYNDDLGNTGLGNVAGSIQYATPSMGGFSAQIIAAPNNTTVAGYGNYTGYGLMYAQGPLNVVLATQSYETSATTTSKSVGIAGSYDLGAVVLYAGNTTTAITNGRQSNGSTFGVKLPMGQSYVTVGAATNKDTTDGVDLNTTAYAAQYIYNWNKQAVIYVGYNSKTAGSAAAVNTSGAGVRYNF